MQSCVNALITLMTSKPHSAPVVANDSPVVVSFSELIVRKPSVRWSFDSWFSSPLLLLVEETLSSSAPELTLSERAGNVLLIVLASNARWPVTRLPYRVGTCLPSRLRCLGAVTRPGP